MYTEYTPCEDPECYGYLDEALNEQEDQSWLEDSSDRYEDSLYDYAENY